MNAVFDRHHTNDLKLAKRRQPEIPRDKVHELFDLEFMSGHGVLLPTPAALAANWTYRPGNAGIKGCIPKQSHNNSDICDFTLYF